MQDIKFCIICLVIVEDDQYLFSEKLFLACSFLFVFFFQISEIDQNMANGDMLTVFCNWILRFNIFRFFNITYVPNVVRNPPHGLWHFIFLVLFCLNAPHRAVNSPGQERGFKSTEQPLPWL